MKDYFQYLVYYFLTVLEAVPNFLLAIFGVYPKCDFSTNFLVGQTLNRVGETLASRESERVSQIQEADSLVLEAKTLDPMSE